MNNETKKIDILAYQYSVVVKGIENRLRDMQYQVDRILDDPERIKADISDTALFIFYLTSDMIDDKIKIAELSNLIGLISAGGGKILFLGELMFQSDMQKLIPEIESHAWLNRPIDMGKFGAYVEELIYKPVKSSADKRVLIVDDDPSFAKMVREWVKDNYRVDIVTAGMQAISFLLKQKETEQVDLILLDYEMPVVDGPQVLQMLRQEPATADIPVVFLTGLATKEAVSRVMELKPAGYIIKSTTREDLLGYLHKMLG